MSIIEEKLPRDLKKAWALEISKGETKVKDDDKFPSLLEFLKERKRAIEYEADDMRNYTVRGDASYLEEDRNSRGKINSREQDWCVIHNSASHSTDICSTFLSMSPQERIKLVWDNKLCYSCLEI